MSTSISIGTQMSAPSGYLMLEKGTTYYFLRSAENACVYLVEFVIRPQKMITKKYGKKTRKVCVTPTPLPQLIAIQRSDFEEGILSGQLIRFEKQALLPPWLAELEGLNLTLLDSARDKAARPHVDRIDRQIEMIYDLVREADSIITSEDPDLLINRHARKCNPPQNETRTRLAFYTYLLFGRNRFALHFPIHKIGNWIRKNMEKKVKQGRPSERYGKGSGNNASQELIDKAVESYIRESGKGVTMKTIYRNFMTNDLGCESVKDSRGLYKFRHPLGKEILTQGMFKYHVEKNIGLKIVQATSKGRNRFRSKTAPQLGSFTQNVCNICERTERDAYAVKALPKGLIEGHPLKPLYVVRGRDTASGIILGVGFSQGGEKSSAYRMELFCRAICKVKFCSLFGIVISKSQWPSIGVSDYDIQDRGAGSTAGASSRIEAIQPIFDEMPPGYTGQSKAVVESSNPKSQSHDDAPDHVISNKRVFELVRDEIFRILKDIESFDISARIPYDLLSYVPRTTPVALYNELDRRGRNDSRQISFPDAVRAYLTKLKAKVTRKGVELHAQLFSSEVLLDSPLLGRMRGPQEPYVWVYVLDACLRHIWIDVDGELLELDIQLPMRIGDEVKNLSLGEIIERQKFLQLARLEHAEHREAIAAKFEECSLQNTGKTSGGGKTVQGRPRRGSAAAKKEAAESRAAVHGDPLK
jgi:hypothetical protein